ncbi:hypothetical protein NRB_06630 [Novosphingobium sp. 11B]
MPTLLVHCVPAPDGVPAAPCGTVDGVALIPVVLAPQPLQIDTSEAPQFFAWGLGLPLSCFVTGLVVGAVMRVIRSA